LDFALDNSILFPGGPGQQNKINKEYTALQID
jgi:hypothetical protein